MEEFTIFDHLDLNGKKTELKIDNNRVVKKWKPIMDALNVPERKNMNEKRIFSDVDPYGEENWDDDLGEYEINPVRVFISVYSEYHSITEIEPLDKNYLPISVKVLSRLNLGNKKYEIKQGLKDTIISIAMSRNQLEDMKFAQGLELVQLIENTLVNELVAVINRELETKNTIYIERLVCDISFISEPNFHPRAILKSKYEVI